MEHLANRDGAVVHLAARAGGPQIGVDVEGEVEQRGPLGQLAQVAVGGEDEDFTRGGLGVEALRQRMGRILHQLAQPAEPLLAGGGALTYPLVAPVGRDTALGYGVHALGANLHLDPPPLGRDGRVERLVAVRLGDGYPVAHAVGVGRVEVGDDGVDRPAEPLLILQRAVDDDADGEDVVDPFEGTRCFCILFQMENIDLVRLLMW